MDHFHFLKCCQFALGWVKKMLSIAVTLVTFMFSGTLGSNFPSVMFLGWFAQRVLCPLHLKMFLSIFKPLFFSLISSSCRQRGGIASALLIDRPPSSWVTAVMTTTCPPCRLTLWPPCRSSTARRVETAARPHTSSQWEPWRKTGWVHWSPWKVQFSDSLLMQPAKGMHVDLACNAMLSACFFFLSYSTSFALHISSLICTIWSLIFLKRPQCQNLFGAGVPGGIEKGRKIISHSF